MDFAAHRNSSVVKGKYPGGQYLPPEILNTKYELRNKPKFQMTKMPKRPHEAGEIRFTRCETGLPRISRSAEFCRRGSRSVELVEGFLLRIHRNDEDQERLNRGVSCIDMFGCD